MFTHEIETDAAPKTDTLHSQRFRTRETVSVSGPDPLDSATGEQADGDSFGQPDRILNNVAAVVDVVGDEGLDDVVVWTVSLTDLVHCDATSALSGNHLEIHAPPWISVGQSQAVRAT